MGGVPRNPAPRHHFLLVWIVKPSGCHCTDAFGGNKYRRVPTPLKSTSPFSDHMKPYSAIPCDAMLYYTRRTALLCHTMPCYAMLCHAMPCYAMLCHAMPCYAMLRHAMPRYAMLCHATHCYATLCYDILQCCTAIAVMFCPVLSCITLSCNVPYCRIRNNKC